MPRYLVGIDLGTTNTALAYVDLTAKPRPGGPKLHTFPVPQLVAAGQVGDQPLLPSFLYLPGPHDLPPGSIDLPWDKDRADVVGEFARNHGAKVPGRLVSSAKSWLCHPGVDRTAPLLPWAAPPDVPRLSPAGGVGPSTSGTSSRPGTPPRAASPRTSSKTSRSSSPCRRRSTTWPAT